MNMNKNSSNSMSNIFDLNSMIGRARKRSRDANGIGSSIHSYIIGRSVHNNSNGGTSSARKMSFLNRSNVLLLVLIVVIMVDIRYRSSSNLLLIHNTFQGFAKDFGVDNTPRRDNSVVYNGHGRGETSPTKTSKDVTNDANRDGNMLSLEGKIDDEDLVELIGKYSFKDASGEIVELNVDQQKALVDIMKSNTGHDVKRDDSGSDSDSNGGEDKNERYEDGKGPETHGSKIDEILKNGQEGARMAGAKMARGAVNVELPVRRDNSRNPSLGVGNVKIMEENERLLRLKQTLALSILRADDLVMKDWSEEQAHRQRSGDIQDSSRFQNPIDFIVEAIIDDDKESQVRLLDSIRRSNKQDTEKYYRKINRLGLVDAAFATPNYFAKWQQFLRMTPDFDVSMHSGGRGIVMCGGSLEYIGPLWLNIQTIRHYGSTLPIEVFGFGGEQPTPLLEDWFSENGVRFIAMDSIIPGGSTLFKGFRLKIFAIIFSSFSELLFLDADAMPILKVDSLFNAQSQNYGAIFWPDYWMASVDSDLLLSLGLNPSINNHMGTHDSGQMIIRKQKGWDAIMLAAFMSLHEDAIFPMLTRNGIGIGDKEVLPIAYKALQISHYKVEHSIIPLGFVSFREDLIYPEQREEGSLKEKRDGDKRDDKVEHKESIVFHGTTMAQFSPNSSDGIAVLHKNCDKWLMKDIGSDWEHFLGQKQWTHYKHFNTTSLHPSSDALEHTFVDAIEPRLPRISGPGSICEIDVYDSQPRLSKFLIMDIEEVERRSRQILLNFSQSEAFLEYERWRLLRFKEISESNKISLDKRMKKIFKSNARDIAKFKYNDVDNQVDEALSFLQNMREKMTKTTGNPIHAKEAATRNQ